MSAVLAEAADVQADGEVVTIGAQATSLFGRFIASAGANHFVTDTRATAGGPGEALQAGQLLLASLASCGLGLIQGKAAEQGTPLREAQAQVSFKRDPDDKTRYRYIRLEFTLTGVAQAVAEDLLGHFTQSCPIYNTLRRGGEVQARVQAQA